jgi:glycosyltransferase involved in cell wall biosynthesis
MLRVIKGPVVCCDYRAYLLTIITSILAVQKVYLYLVGGIPLTRSAVKTLNRFASEVYFISKELGNECGDMSPRVLINGIDTSKLRQVEIFKENALNFVFVGTLVQQKGLHVIITALQNLESSNWRLDVIGDYLVGDENYKEYIEYLTKDDNRINFLGKVDDVFDRLSSYTALMFGSQKSNTINWKGNKYIVESSEGSPTVIIEAALSGIPVFASISTGVRELSLELPNVTIVDWDSFHYEIIEASLKARVNVSEATIDLFDYTKIYKEYLNDINESV